MTQTEWCSVRTSCDISELRRELNTCAVPQTDDGVLRVLTHDVQSPQVGVMIGHLLSYRHVQPVQGTGCILKSGKC